MSIALWNKAGAEVILKDKHVYKTPGVFIKLHTYMNPPLKPSVGMRVAGLFYRTSGHWIMTKTALLVLEVGIDPLLGTG